MNRQTYRKISLGTVSAFVILGGMVLVVTLHILFTEVVLTETNKELIKDEIERKIYYNSSKNAIKEDLDKIFKGLTRHIWEFGLLFVIPGILGVFAAFVQHTALYAFITFLGFHCLLPTGLLFTAQVLGLHYVVLIVRDAKPGQCVTSGTGCQCKFEGELINVNIPFTTCEVIIDILHPYIFFTAVNGVTWILLIVETVMSCTFGCKNRVICEHHLIRKTSMPAQQPAGSPVPVADPNDVGSSQHYPNSGNQQAPLYSIRFIQQAQLYPNIGNQQPQYYPNFGNQQHRFYPNMDHQQIQLYEKIGNAVIPSYPSAPNQTHPYHPQDTANQTITSESNNAHHTPSSHPYKANPSHASHPNTAIEILHVQNISNQTRSSSPNPANLQHLSMPNAENQQRPSMANIAKQTL